MEVPLGVRIHAFPHCSKRNFLLKSVTTNLRFQTASKYYFALRSHLLKLRYYRMACWIWLQLEIAFSCSINIKQPTCSYRNFIFNLALLNVVETKGLNLMFLNPFIFTKDKLFQITEIIFDLSFHFHVQ